jgi:hypothetical protein
MYVAHISLLNDLVITHIAGRLEDALAYYKRSQEFGVERAAVHIRNVRLEFSIHRTANNQSTRSAPGSLGRSSKQLKSKKRPYPQALTRLSLIEVNLIVLVFVSCRIDG